MKISALDFTYPSELIATEPRRPSRVAFMGEDQEPVELTVPELLKKFAPGDLLVVNDTKVIPARVFSQAGDEILFLQSADALSWEVLFPARDYKLGATLNLPGDITARLEQKGIPQKLRVSRPLTEGYFSEFGELALPPYIQEERGERHNRAQERMWYQPAWAEIPGSVAAPTASLHFTLADLQTLKDAGIEIATVTLHVGAGTFLPMRGENPEHHEMHGEKVFIADKVIQQIQNTKGRIWALGTTATRALESWAHGHLRRDENGFTGETRLFIYPPFEFRVVDALLTNFHQPRSTLLLLVAAFVGEQRVREVYKWAVDKKFRLFSYGDLTAWIR